MLDAFGGTCSVSLMFKRYGKQVYYNDLLSFNQTIGKAIVENRRVTVSESDLNQILNHNPPQFCNFISSTFRGIFFLDLENKWLDRIIANIAQVSNSYKKAILLAALFQSCLAKRPFNLFHRANLYLRTANVSRTFGNKTTWERPFSELMSRFVHEYNRAVFDNGRSNKVIGGYDAVDAPSGLDLVYLDPPYFSAHPARGTDYIAFYHFLEGLADYPNWGGKINCNASKIKRIDDVPEIHKWTRKSTIVGSFRELIERYQNSIIVLSYQSNGVPAKEEIITILRKYKRKVTMVSRPHRYVLSRTTKEELIFIAR